MPTYLETSCATHKISENCFEAKSTKGFYRLCRDFQKNVDYRFKYRFLGSTLKPVPHVCLKKLLKIIGILLQQGMSAF